MMEKQQRGAKINDELKKLWRDGVESGPGRFGSINEIKAEVRLRFDISKLRG